MNDELERDDLDAWDVEPLGAGFEDRVMDAVHAVEAPPSSEAPTHGRAVVWAAALSLAAAAALVIALWPRDDAPLDDAISIQAGVSARVNYTAGSHQAEQTRGTVTYRVRSGTPFVVHTPAADVTVRGTEFTVEMLTMQDERRRKHLGAAALAMGGAAVAVYVASGEVAVHNEHGRAAVGPGEIAVASEHAEPRSKVAPVVAEARPAGTPSLKPKRAKQISAAQREDVRRRIHDALASEKAGEVPSRDEDAVADDEPPPGTLDKEYIQSVIQEDLLPIATECYQSALDDDPELGGRMMLEFSIVGDASVGGLVDEVSIDEEASTFKHPSLGECMTESTASLLFDPPEQGGRMVVRYPFVFTANDSDDNQGADDATAAD